MFSGGVVICAAPAGVHAAMAVIAAAAASPVYSRAFSSPWTVLFSNPRIPLITIVNLYVFRIYKCLGFVVTMALLKII